MEKKIPETPSLTSLEWDNEWLGRLLLGIPEEGKSLLSKSKSNPVIAR